MLTFFKNILKFCASERVRSLKYEKINSRSIRQKANIYNWADHYDSVSLWRVGIGCGSLFNVPNHIRRKAFLMNHWDVFEFDSAKGFADLVANLQRGKAEFHTRQEGDKFIVVVYSSYTN